MVIRNVTVRILVGDILFCSALLPVLRNALHLVMKRGSTAAKSAKYGLVILDEAARFRTIAPTNSRDHQ